MTDYGVTEAGFVLKPLGVILDEVAAQQRAIIDPNLNTESDSVFGQFNGILGDQVAQLWEVLEAEYYSLSRAADGAALDIVGALTGTARNPASKSAGTLTLNLSAGVTVPAGSIVSVAGDPSIRAVTTADAVNSGGSPANVNVAAQAETAGAVTANPGTLTVIETPIAGWNTATNATSLTGGAPIEGDDAYRSRQLEELAAGGGGSVPGIASDLRAVTGVIAAKVIENDTMATVDGVPAKSIEAVVRTNGIDAGVDQAIATALFESKSGGIYTHGSAGPFTVTDDQGVDHAVRFTRPTERRVYAALGLTVTGDLTSIGAAAALKIAATTLTSNDPAYLGVGADVYAARMVVTALGVPGVLNAQVGLSFSPITDPDAGSLALSIADREIATVAAADIARSAL